MVEESSSRPEPDHASISRLQTLIRYAVMLMAWRADFFGHLMVLIYGLVFGYPHLYAPMRQYETPEL